MFFFSDNVNFQYVLLLIKDLLSYCNRLEDNKSIVLCTCFSKSTLLLVMELNCKAIKILPYSYIFKFTLNLKFELYILNIAHSFSLSSHNYSGFANFLRGTKY